MDGRNHITVTVTTLPMNLWPCQSSKMNQNYLKPSKGLGLVQQDVLPLARFPSAKLKLSPFDENFLSNGFMRGTLSQMFTVKRLQKWRFKRKTSSKSFAVMVPSLFQHSHGALH